MTNKNFWRDSFLSLAGSLYGWGIAIRHLAYERGWIKINRVPIPVISVGNIAVGGAGKTPVVQMLARELSKDCKVSVLTRGFRSQLVRSNINITGPNGPRFPAYVCGDEPFLHSSLLKIPVWVGKKRSLTADKAFKEGAECLILDDGMQHRRLERDFEVVVVDGTNPLEYGKFFPRGRLREHPERLKVADLIVANHIESKEEVEKVAEVLKPYTSAPLVAVTYRMRPFNGKKVGLFCALGNPSHFIKKIQGQGIEIVETLLLIDHQPITLLALSRFATACREKGAEALLCTEKDFVKLDLISIQGMPIQPIHAELEIVSGHQAWNQFLETVRGTLAAKMVS